MDAIDWSYWTAYWWMLPLGVVICTTACAASVEGATMFTPLFALGFPLLGASALTPGQAIATGLIIESVGYSSGLLGHGRQRTIVWRQAGMLAAVAVPVAAASAAVALRVPGEYLLLAVAGVLLSLGVLVFRSAALERPSHAHSTGVITRGSDGRVIHAADGRTYWCSPDRRPSATALTTAAAGAVTGLVGISIGEVTTAQLMLRLHWPARVAIGTGVGVVLPTVVTAGVVQAAQLSAAGVSIPWNLVVWVVPAVLVGGQLGPRLTAVIPERDLKRAVAVLFAALAVVVTVSTLGPLAS